MVTTAWPTTSHAARGIFVKRQADALSQLGVDVDVLHICGHVSKHAYVAAARELRWGSAAVHDYRLVHAQSAEAGAVAWLRPGGPLLITYFGSDVLGSRDASGQISWQAQARARLLRLTAVTATATVTQSEEMHQSLPRCLRNRDHVLLNGVDLKRFTPRDRAAARGELGWPLEGKVAIFVAAHPETPLKRLWLAKAAVDRAREEATDLRLEIISGVSPDQMPMIMAAADCLLHTSASEGSPNVVKEAMACNLPVAATPVGDIPSLLTDVDGAAVCDPTPEHLADGILRCLRAGHSNGRAKAWQFDHLRVTKRLIDLYEAIAPG